MQFKWVPNNICFHKVDKKYTGCNLKTTELPDCAILGVCAVIMLNTVLITDNALYIQSKVMAG